MDRMIHHLWVNEDRNGGDTMKSVYNCTRGGVQHVNSVLTFSRVESMTQGSSATLTDTCGDIPYPVNVNNVPPVIEKFISSKCY